MPERPCRDAAALIMDHRLDMVAGNRLARLIYGREVPDDPRFVSPVGEPALRLLSALSGDGHPTVNGLPATNVS
ncbi:hypothetical protein Nocox_01545 [Nonomuraea coxensis DSM 45129]|uniref:Uncharacterized protein n=1 Tax=Nonomuraea coxensis DSM 45129 TaxID=1122611 RepID=A0ABX8TS44_9ACTN|nr:hypothetical protein [Nonomuraea coxensis]QYC37943.1 hypothetical protein Nocox_01545 [Nonomuraea coxensis DSM 45129]